MVAGARDGSIPTSRVEREGYLLINGFWIQNGFFGQQSIAANILKIKEIVKKLSNHMKQYLIMGYSIKVK